MIPDLDDTIRSVDRAAATGIGGDLDDTIVGRPGPASTGVAASAPPRAPEPAPPAQPSQPAAAAPPARYGFRIGRSERTVLLDVAAYVGRSPSSPRISNGELPKLIRVQSPKGEVSGTHLEIRQLGTSVIVTDLRSTNGSTVSVPGSAPRSLRQGEAMVVTPGTLVDIGDGNIIEILPLQRHLGPTGHERPDGHEE
ncbi:hypothetical protein ABIE21_000330 [Conyzicola nivalis]|uniref:FHA domain-containing protein n=1 Tax=Conyzicola nivalis TaxID=1477021 RepID=A0ABV2QII9_9MICO